MAVVSYSNQSPFRRVAGIAMLLATATAARPRRETTSDSSRWTRRPRSCRPSPTRVLGLALSQPTYRTGQTLQLTVSVQNPGGGPTCDFYVVLQLPGSSTAVSIRLGAGPVFGSVANLRSLVPVVSGVRLSGAFAVSQPLFQYAFNGSEPQGSYVVYFVAVRSGAFANGVIDAGELLALQTQTFQFTTAPGTSTVEIEQAAVLLTAQGATRQLTAIVKDGFGNRTGDAVTWASTRPDQVAVDATGLVRAVVANGSSQITASSRGVASAPLLVLATPAAPGATLVTDAQIVGAPVESDPNAPPSANNTYQVVLRGAGVPVVGSLLINTGLQPVAGKVVAVSVSGNDTLVTLGLTSLRELFPDLAIDEAIDLTQAPIAVAPALASAYDVQRTGNTFSFTPKPSAAAAFARPASPPTAVGTRALFPYECETSIGLPIELSTPPIFSVTVNPTLDVLYTPANGLERFVVRAEPTVKIEGGISLTAAFEGKIECKVELFTFRIPVGGPLSMVIGGLVPVGVGFETGGKFTVATMGIGTKVEAKATTSIGVACPAGGSCAFVKQLGGVKVDATPTVDLPSIGDVRVEPSLSAFGFLKAAIGNPFFKSLRLDAFQAKLGGKFSASFAAATSQLADASYRSGYKISLDVGASVGTDLDGVAKLLGLSSITAIEVSIGTDLAQSPAPAAINAVTASRSAFSVGDAVTFTVNLDPATVNFFPGIGPYNVSQVVLVRGQTSPMVVGTVAAVTGQTAFTIPFTSPGPGSAAEFSAFVITALLPQSVFALEIGRAVGPQVAIVSSNVTASLTAGFSGPPQQLSKSDPILVTAMLDPQPPQGSGAPDANASATGEVVTEAANHVLRLTGNVSTSAEGSSLGTPASATASMESQLVADVTASFTCRVDVSWSPTVVRAATSTLTVRVMRDGVLVHQAAAAGTNTQLCSTGRYTIDATAAVAASSATNSDDAHGDGTFTVTVTLTPP